MAGRGDFRGALAWSAAALVGGALWGLCFQRQPLHWGPWLALAPLLALLGTRRPLLLGFFFGLASWLTAIPWIAPTLEAYGGLSRWMAWGGLLVLAAYLASFVAFFAALGAPLWRRGGAVAALGLPALWVAAEWLRGTLFTGFPWNLAAYSWVEVPGALELAPWIGSHGVSYLVVLANVGVASILFRGRWRAGVAALGVCVLLLVGGRLLSTPKVATKVAEGEGGRVRLLQPNVPNLSHWDEAAAMKNYARVLALSHRACAPGTLVVWPESAAWPFSWQAQAFLRRDLEELTSTGCAVLLNTPWKRPEGYANAALLVASGELRGRYEKRHLVPFGEYVPLGEWLPFMESLARGAGDFLPGADPGVLRWGELPLGISICFEVIFPGEVAELVRAGAGALVTITNDAWYGDTSAPWQHFRAARFRAAENRRLVLRAAITGVSGVIGPDGSVRQSLGVGESGVLEGVVAPRRELTPFTRAPWAFPAASGVLATACLLLAWGPHGQRRGRSR